MWDVNVNSSSTKWGWELDDNGIIVLSSVTKNKQSKSWGTTTLRISKTRALLGKSEKCDLYFSETIINASHQTASQAVELFSWWRHQMETFSALLANYARNSPVLVNYPHKGQWRRALMFSLMCVWINGWVNKRDFGDLIHHRAHYDVIVMLWRLWSVCGLVLSWICLNSSFPYSKMHSDYLFMCV